MKVKVTEKGVALLITIEEVVSFEKAMRDVLHSIANAKEQKEKKFEVFLSSHGGHGVEVVGALQDAFHMAKNEAIDKMLHLPCVVAKDRDSKSVDIFLGCIAKLGIQNLVAVTEV